MRIAIVNDVQMAVEAMRRVVAGSREHQVAWIARDGAEAVQLCSQDTPDLVLMDLIMPVMDGVEATRRIMARTPCPIIVVTASVTNNSSKVFEALGVGALDAVNTPVLEYPHSSVGPGAGALLAKIQTIRRLIGVAPSIPGPAGDRLPPALHLNDDCLVAIGASAGGPAALARVLSGLPHDFPAPIVLVQHVDAQFVRGLSTWLASQTPLELRVAQSGDVPFAGTVLLAGGEDHLLFTAPKRLAYSAAPEDCSYRPSIDVFFRSANEYWPGDIVGVLLTGMGRDGAEGLSVLRASGHHTIAQDQSSSAVYGMPKAAVELRAASEILPLEKIASRLKGIVSAKYKLHG